MKMSKVGFKFCQIPKRPKKLSDFKKIYSAFWHNFDKFGHTGQIILSRVCFKLKQLCNY